MKINQVYTILNSVVQQMNGDIALAKNDLSGLIALGNEILDSSQADYKDNFLNCLVDRIGKTIVSVRAYSPDVKSVINDPFTFGAILQKIYVEPMVAKQSKQWGLTDGTAVDQYIISKPSAKQKLFSGLDTWEVDITIPDIQLRTAFTSETAMTVFIDAIFTAMYNSMENELEAMINMCYCNFIGEKYAENKGIYKKDLVTDYNALMTKTLTADTALTDAEFLRYATAQINLYMLRMEKMNDLFNAQGYRRFTPMNLQKVLLHADFESAVKTNMQSTTFHDNLVQLPYYSTTPYWQGTGLTYAFADTSKIDIKTSSGIDESVSNIIGMVTDVEALGVTIQNRRSKSVYNNQGEYTNYFEKADMGYFNDLSEQGMIFTLN